MGEVNQALRLVLDGVLVVNEAIKGDELEMMRDGFERLCAESGKRQFEFNGISKSPEMMGWIGHPSMMNVVTPFVQHFGHEPAIACISGVRDVFNPERAPKGRTPPEALHQGKGIGWHDDVWGVTEPQFSVMETSLSCLLYLDDTYIDSGAYCTAVGSHHLVVADENDSPRTVTFEVVRDLCELKALPVKAGSLIFHRAHNWHGVVPPHQQRRIYIQTFTTLSQYDGQAGHTQFTDEQLELIPEDRHKYIRRYAHA